MIQKRLLNRVSKGHSLPNVFRSPRVNQKVEETAQTDREGQEQPGSERAADVAEDETRPESGPVVDETRHDVGPTSELETLVKEEEGKQQSDIDSVRSLGDHLDQMSLAPLPPGASGKFETILQRTPTEMRVQ